MGEKVYRYWDTQRKEYCGLCNEKTRFNLKYEFEKRYKFQEIDIGDPPPYPETKPELTDGVYWVYFDKSHLIRIKTGEYMYDTEGNRKGHIRQYSDIIGRIPVEPVE
jgi:hypothetical protein